MLNTPLPFALPGLFLHPSRSFLFPHLSTLQTPTYVPSATPTTSTPSYTPTASPSTATPTTLSPSFNPSQVSLMLKTPLPSALPDLSLFSSPYHSHIPTKQIPSQVPSFSPSFNPTPIPSQVSVSLLACALFVAPRGIPLHPSTFCFSFTCPCFLLYTTLTSQPYRFRANCHRSPPHSILRRLACC